MNIQFAIAITAALSAFFWALSAVVRLPARITVGYGGSGGSIDDLGKALKRQGSLNAFAAGFATISAACQAVAAIGHM